MLTYGVGEEGEFESFAWSKMFIKGSGSKLAKLHIKTRLDNPSKFFSVTPK